MSDELRYFHRVEKIQHIGQNVWCSVVRNAAARVLVWPLAGIALACLCVFGVLTLYAWTQQGEEDLAELLVPTVVVAADGSGDYTTLQEAWNAVPDGSVVVVKSGTYAGFHSMGDSKSILWLGMPEEESVPKIVGTVAAWNDSDMEFDGFVFEPETGSAAIAEGAKLVFVNCCFDGSRMLGGSMIEAWHESEIELIHCTVFERRESPMPRPVLRIASTSNLLVVNSILWNPRFSREIEATHGAVVEAESSIVRGGGHGAWDEDPLLTEQGGRFTAESPARGRAKAGWTEVDIYGQERGIAPDLGCYEFTDWLDFPEREKVTVTEGTTTATAQTTVVVKPSNGEDPVVSFSLFTDGTILNINQNYRFEVSVTSPHSQIVRVWFYRNDAIFATYASDHPNDVYNIGTSSACTMAPSRMEVLAEPITYTVVATDAGGCSTSASIAVTFQKSDGSGSISEDSARDPKDTGQELALLLTMNNSEGTVPMTLAARPLYRDEDKVERDTSCKYYIVTNSGEAQEELVLFDKDMDFRFVRAPILPMRKYKNPEGNPFARISDMWRMGTAPAHEMKTGKSPVMRYGAFSPPGSVERFP